MGISNSPFERHLGTNFIPSPSEIQDIKSLLHDPKAELLRLETEVFRLQKKCDQLRQHIAVHQALISPARRLPRDIIQEIFVHCLPSTHNINVEMKASQAPLLLGRICGAWRTISLSIPSLWDSIHIAAPVMPSNNNSLHSQALFDERKWMTDLLVLAVEEWLERSGMRPLSISLIQSRMFDSRDKQLSYPLFSAILRFRRRWQNVKIQATCFQSAESITELAECGITNSMPWLTSLWLRGPLGPKELRESLLPFVAPKLYKMSLHWMGNFTTIHFPWHQLTELVLDLVPTIVGFEQQVVDLLSTCTRLEKFRASILDMPSEIVPRHVCLPFLNSFTLLENMDAAKFVSALHLPALRHLAFSATRSIPSSLLDLLRRFGGQLETLDLGVYIRTGLQISDCLRLTPRLVRLGIEKPSIFGGIDPLSENQNNDYHIAFLSHLSDGLCPLLEELSFFDGPRFPDQQLLEFILSRRRSSSRRVSKIKQITAIFYRTRQIDIAKELSDLGEDEGLTLRLLYSQGPVDRIALGYTLPLLSNPSAN